MFGTALGLVGTVVLLCGSNGLAAAVAGSTLLLYVLVYTPLKPWTTLNTAIGAIPGALPPVIGWAAATGTLGIEALALFLIVFLWQFPHFLAIAWIYREDYARGGMKMLPEIDPQRRAHWPSGHDLRAGAGPRRPAAGHHRPGRAVLLRAAPCFWVFSICCRSPILGRASPTRPPAGCSGRRSSTCRLSCLLLVLNPDAGLSAGRFKLRLDLDPKGFNHDGRCHRLPDLDCTPRPTAASHSRDHHAPVTPGKVAMWLFLATEVMFFTGLIGSYIVLRTGSPSTSYSNLYSSDDEPRRTSRTPTASGSSRSRRTRGGREAHQAGDPRASSETEAHETVEEAHEGIDRQPAHEGESRGAGCPASTISGSRRRQVEPLAVHNWPKPYDKLTNPLSINLTAFNTFVLICSSVTMVPGALSHPAGERGGS